MPAIASRVVTTNAEREHTRRRLNGLAAETEADPAGRVPDWLESEPEERRTRTWLPERFQGARIDPGKRGTIALAGFGAVIAVVAALLVVRQPAAGPVPAIMPVEPVATAITTTMAAPLEIVVSVVGLVTDPGLVTLQPGARVDDAIEAAGGAAKGADLLALNLAQKLNDGEQVVVGPESGANQPSAVLSSGTSGSSGSAGGGGDLVNLNSATETELDALPGVGPVTAASIVAWREANGRFDSLDQLAEVEGIGPSRLAKLRDLVTL